MPKFSFKNNYKNITHTEKPEIVEMSFQFNGKNKLKLIEFLKKLILDYKFKLFLWPQE